MRTALVMLIVSGLLLCGCGPKPEPPAAEPQPPDTTTGPAPPAEETKPAEPPEQKPAPEPADSAAKKPKGYIETVVSQPARMKIKFDNLALKQSLEAYKAMNGEYPKTLDDLKKEGMPAPPPPAGKKYEYDPKTGTVWLVGK